MARNMFSWFINSCWAPSFCVVMRPTQSATVKCYPIVYERENASLIWLFTTNCSTWCFFVCLIPWKKEVDSWLAILKAMYKIKHTFKWTQVITVSIWLPFQISINWCCTPKSQLPVLCAGVVCCIIMSKWKYAYIFCTIFFFSNCNLILVNSETVAVIG